MILALPVYFFGFVLRILAAIGGTIKFIIPVWLNDGLAWIMSGAGILNAFLPMYPHPEMSGLAAEMGIMTIFGWALVMLAALIGISILWWCISLLVGVLPWNTFMPKFPSQKK